MADRWKPTRAGIRNVWEYDDQVFDFADGRMILRGPNGSGKSNALALLFPFLFDGTMSANAMDPFAGGRSMRSLLLGVVRDDAAAQGFRHDRRLGYVWIEFGDGERHVTVGCGARATIDAPNPRSWFFVTPRRVGIDLALDHDGEVHERRRLIEVLGHEAVVDTAEEFRSALDREVLGTGSDRHRKLVGLIRVLRRPQLAGKLNLDLLSDVLSSGLPGLGDEVLADIASSLDDLESTQRELADVQEARATVETFLPVYATYLRGEAARRAAAVRTAEAARQAARTRAADARIALERIGADLVANAEARTLVDADTAATDAEKIAVIESPAFKDASSLRELDAAAGRAQSAREGAASRAAEAADDHQSALDAADEAETAAAGSGRSADEALTVLIDAADAGDLAWTLPSTDSTDPDRVAAAARSAELSRRDDLREVRHALAARRPDRRRPPNATDRGGRGRRRSGRSPGTGRSARCRYSGAAHSPGSSRPRLGRHGAPTQRDPGDGRSRRSARRR